MLRKLVVSIIKNTRDKRGKDVQYWISSKNSIIKLLLQCIFSVTYLAFSQRIFFSFFLLVFIFFLLQCNKQKQRTLYSLYAAIKFCSKIAMNKRPAEYINKDTTNITKQDFKIYSFTLNYENIFRQPDIIYAQQAQPYVNVRMKINKER